MDLFVTGTFLGDGSRVVLTEAASDGGRFALFCGDKTADEEGAEFGEESDEEAIYVFMTQMERKPGAERYNKNGNVHDGK